MAFVWFDNICMEMPCGKYKALHSKWNRHMQQQQKTMKNDFRSASPLLINSSTSIAPAACPANFGTRTNYQRGFSSFPHLSSANPHISHRIECIFSQHIRNCLSHKAIGHRRFIVTINTACSRRWTNPCACWFAFICRRRVGADRLQADAFTHWTPT